MMFKNFLMTISTVVLATTGIAYADHHDAKKCSCECHEKHMTQDKKQIHDKKCELCKKNHTDSQGKSCNHANQTITVNDGFVRPSASIGSPTAAYLNIANTSDISDTLVSITSDVTSSVEIHNTNVDKKGVMQMMPLTGGLEIPAKTTIQLKPRGMHLMLLGTTKKLSAGETITLNLEFKNSGKQTVKLPVEM